MRRLLCMGPNKEVGMRTLRILSVSFGLLLLLIPGCGGGGDGSGSTPTKAVSTVGISVVGSAQPIVCGLAFTFASPPGTALVSAAATGVATQTTVDYNQATKFVSLAGSSPFGSGEVATVNFSISQGTPLPADFTVASMTAFDCTGSVITTAQATITSSISTVVQ